MQNTLLRWLLTALILVAMLLLTRLLPFSYFFRTLDTMIHEFGHAAATLVLSGSVLAIELNANHSGVTYSLIEPGWRSLLVTLTGYFTASLFAVLLFWLFARRRERSGLIGMTVLAVLMLLLFVHEGYGLVWLIGFSVVNLAVLLLGRFVRSFYFLLLAFITLEESVLAPLSLLLLAWTDPARAGDASSLARMTWLPAWLWALFFLLGALVCARYALRYFMQRLTTRSRESAYPTYYERGGV
ncbi:M50 family metallopeptidase [Paenibacillus sp. IB182496]|uniref:M50 family metallopeptidase n=1 Tax=Paenibacillus sabuli TaxID=2772509 RepID=A0A927GQD9_9BACL|nr:M50 family metallopeptidase [Paenibacillus sabuli]MBD2844278.1 M50 family metallopeptidase [Paenibacillus sabuli]